MSDTVKLIIEIPESIFDTIQADEMISREQLAILQMHILNGISLDDVKAEIAEEVCLTDNPYTKETKYTIEHSKLLDILDNIGKESEE